MFSNISVIHSSPVFLSLSLRFHWLNTWYSIHSRNENFQKWSSFSSSIETIKTEEKKALTVSSAQGLVPFKALDCLQIRETGLNVALIQRLKTI